MLNATVAYYVRCFDRLNCAQHPLLGEAPHKPVLLLAVIQMVAMGALPSHQVDLNAVLERVFEDTWRQYVRTRHKMNLAQPFFHMQNEPFWRLQRSAVSDDDFFNKNKMKNLNSLKQQVNNAVIDDELWACLQDMRSREDLKAFLVMRYFNKTQPQPEEDLPNKEATILSMKNHMMPRIIWRHDWLEAMMA